MQVAKRTGAVIEVIPEDVEGDLYVSALETLIIGGRKPALIAITHVPTNSGDLQLSLLLLVISLAGIMGHQQHMHWACLAGAVLSPPGSP